MDIYAAFMQSPVAIVILKGNDYIIDFANDFYIEMFCKEKSITGKPFFDVFPLLKAEGLLGFLNSVIESGESRHVNEYACSYTRKGKTEAGFFNCDYQPLIGNSCGTKGIILILTPVTALVLEKRQNLIHEQHLQNELSMAKTELAFLGGEKKKRAAELGIANIELAFQDDEKEKRAAELSIANVELVFQNDEKEKRAAELIIANEELAFQDNEKEKRANELALANEELLFQNEEKEKRANELIIANKELTFQNTEKEKRAAELGIANNELNQSERLLMGSLKEVSDYKDALDEATIIAITDQKGIIKKANSNFCKISKYSEEELIGQDHRLINSGYHPKEFIRDLWTTIANGKRWKGEIKNKAKDGSFYWVDTTIVPFINEEGKPYQYLAIRIDITKRKESEEQLTAANIELDFQNKEKEKRAAELIIANYARSLIEASLDPLVTISAAGKILDVNEASVKVTGVPREKLIDTDFSSYFTEPAKAQEGYRRVFEKGFVADYPLTIKHKNGHLTDVLYNASVYKDDKGNVLGVFAAARDVTEQKQIEDELLKTQERLNAGLKIANIALSEISYITNTVQLSPESAAMYGFPENQLEATRQQMHDTFHQSRVRSSDYHCHESR
jgi:PAS domain S-box-containing protein